MIITLYILFFVLMIACFVGAFFAKQEILWALTLLLSGVLMYTSYSVEFFTYVFNESIGAYEPTMISYSYPYLMGINMVFFSLGLVLAIFDLFDKYRNSDED